MNISINTNCGTTIPASAPQQQTAEEATQEEILFNTETDTQNAAPENELISDELSVYNEIAGQNELDAPLAPPVKTGIEATLDGQISATKQGTLGDCWLLSSVNALNSTQQGKELIKEILNYDENGVSVNLKGLEKAYYFTNEQLKQAQNSGEYSNGDLDMNAIELAVQSAFDDICNDRVKLPESVIDQVDGESVEPFAIHNTKGPGYINNLGNNILNDNTSQYALYLLTGQVSYLTNGGDFNQTADELYFFGDNNNENRVMTATISQDRKTVVIDDIYGNKVELPSNHLYSISKVENGMDKNLNETNITIVDPHDSSKEITLNRSKFMGVFDWFTNIILNK